MPVYFIVNNEQQDHSGLWVKIGRSKDIKRRLRNLQTGSSSEQQWMGWMETEDNKLLEYDLHNKYAGQKIQREWYTLTPHAVLKEIKSYGLNGYIAPQQNTFKIFAR